MKIYIAGKFTAREHLKEYRQKLQDLGYECVCTWMDVPEDSAPVPEAIRDLNEIRESDILIVDTFDESNTGGREVEIGYAMALGKRIYQVGPQRNVFHSLLDHRDSWNNVLSYLQATAQEFYLCDIPL